MVVRNRKKGAGSSKITAGRTGCVKGQEDNSP